MRIFCQHKSIYTLNKLLKQQIFTEAQKADPRYKVINQWETLRKEGVSFKTCQKILNISRATYYRYKKAIKHGIKPLSRKPRKTRVATWSREEAGLVLKIRLENKTYGKEKIWKILTRDHGFKKSESTVGRIIKKLKEQGLIQLSASAPRYKRTRKFTRHAKRWMYGMKAHKIGCLVQIDHMSVTKNQISFKHFQVWDKKSKYIYAKVYSAAKSSSAKKFLLDLLKQAPFPITSIQVDGGSEFMGYFEDACKELNIPLYVLPARSPKLNGGVERANRIFREEFYRKHSLADTIASINAELVKELEKYNNYRPHHALNLMTPMEYIKTYP